MRRPCLLALVLATALAAGAAPAAPLTRAQALHALEQADASARLAAIERLGEIGRMDDADRVLARLADPDPRVRAGASAAVWRIWSRSGDPAIDKLFARGTEQMEAADLDEALATFSTIVSKKPAFAEGWNKRATILFLLGRHEESLKDCDQVLKRNPGTSARCPAPARSICSSAMPSSRSTSCAAPWRSIRTWRARLRSCRCSRSCCASRVPSNGPEPGGGVTPWIIRAMPDACALTPLPTRRASLLALAGFALGGCGGGGMEDGESSFAGTLVTRSIVANSNGTNYPLYIYLPPGLAAIRNTVPVIYLLDGDSRIAAVVDIVERTQARVIVVGIGNEAMRSRDYVPANVCTSGGGGHAAYLDFIRSSSRPRSRPTSAATRAAGSCSDIRTAAASSSMPCSPRRRRRATSPPTWRATPRSTA